MIDRRDAGPANRQAQSWLQVSAEWLWSLLPGVLVVFLGFDAGGFFAGTTGLVAAVLAVLVAFHLLSSERVSVGVPGWVAIAGLGAYTAWSILSGTWSGAPARALLAFDRGVLYLGVIALGLMAPTRRRVLIRGILAGVVVVCAAGFLSRALPHVFPVPAQYLNQRLSYPVSYWNALGMVAALGIALGVHVASENEEPVVFRALACAVVPLLASTLLLTFSRGSNAALVVMIVVYVLAAPRRLRFLGTALALAVPTAIAVIEAYDADQLAKPNPTTPAAITQGHHLALAVAVCMLAAAVLIVLVRLAEARFSVPRVSRRAAGGALACAVAVVLVAGGAAGGAGWLSRQFHRFANESVVRNAGPTRTRLLSPSNNGRLEMWRVAVHGFESHPWRGQGAGTYQLLWERRRPSTVPVVNAHSLYLESLDELGLVGTLALLAALVALLFGIARKLAREPERPAAALALGLFGAWMLHAGVDWDWQMPVVTAPVLWIAAAVAGGPTSPETRSWRFAWVARPLGALLCLGLAVGPALVAVSQAELDSSVQAFHQGNCPSAIADARSSSSAVSWRPEPYELIAYCEAREQHPAQALAAGGKAIKRDPHDWEFHYALALVRAWAGRNPRPQLEAARRLDPLEPMIQTALHVLATPSPKDWRQGARRLATDIP